jgi:hypothetical protein
LTRQLLLKNTLSTRQRYPDISAVAGGAIASAGDIRIFWPPCRRCRCLFLFVLARSCSSPTVHQWALEPADLLATYVSAVARSVGDAGEPPPGRLKIKSGKWLAISSAARNPQARVAGKKIRI